MCYTKINNALIKLNIKNIGTINITVVQQKLMGTHTPQKHFVCMCVCWPFVAV